MLLAKFCIALLINSANSKSKVYGHKTLINKKSLTYYFKNDKEPKKSVFKNETRHFSYFSPYSFNVIFVS